MAYSKHMMLRFYLRVLLFFPLPMYVAIFTTDSTLTLALGVTSLLAVPLHFYWMRKRFGPFLTFLVCVYLAQTVLWLSLAHLRRAAHHTKEAVKPDSPIRTISVVMAAHNEQAYLKRTLDSILETTPSEVLVEIIVIDDGSEPALEELTKDYKEVKLIRNDKRQGLIKSKVAGGNLATGDMIMFLDAHVKPSRSWYQPLLRHVNINYKRVVVPMIPILDGETWKINSRAVGVKMMFDWRLHFKWFDDGNDLVPCMSGGLFGITKQWWHESGEYDNGMNMWGGENIEQSIRIWLCGGEIFVARNSQIGHVFRTEFPYAINNTEIEINKIRAVETWFGQYKDYYYHADPQAAALLPAMGDISGRLDLKADLQCRDFSWYVEKFWKVFQEKGMLPRQSFNIKDMHTGRCLAVNENGDRILEASCDTGEGRQRWTHYKGALQNAGSGLCLDAATEAPEEAGAHKATHGRSAELKACQTRKSTQKWKWDHGRIHFQKSCLDSRTDGELHLASCMKFRGGAGPSFSQMDHQVMPPGDDD
mmetsp:Transcript_64288/g.151010  ORF Transcript_64288/g.151010 Transcript_64288/m.151010 type:complete len:533 (-) Transcript_64288:12-1610(-)